MATLRDERTKDASEFVGRTRYIRDLLRSHDLAPGKVIVEACLHDSNKALDASWIAPRDLQTAEVMVL